MVLFFLYKSKLDNNLIYSPAILGNFLRPNHNPPKTDIENSVIPNLQKNPQ